MTFNFSANDRVKHGYLGFGDVVEPLGENTVRVQFDGFFDVRDIHRENLSLIVASPPELIVNGRINLKKGDRVESKSGGIGTVQEDEGDYAYVSVTFDNGYTGNYKADSLKRLVGSINPKEVHSVPKTPNNSSDFLYKKDDRVKLKYNGSIGTVVRDQVGSEGAIFVVWDKSGKYIWEEPKNLVTLHAPRHTDEPHPNQELIDQIESVRLPLKAEVERKQALLKHMTQALKIAKQV